MFFYLKYFFCSCLIFFISVQVGAGPLFVYDLKIRNSTNDEIFLFAENDEIRLRHDVFEETLEIVLPSRKKDVDGSLIQEERCIPFDPDYSIKKTTVELGETVSGDQVLTRSVTLSYCSQSNLLEIKDNSNNETHIVPCTDYITNLRLHSLQERISLGRYGESDIIDGFLSRSKEQKIYKESILLEVEALWKTFSEQYKAGFIASNLKALLEYTYTGIVCANVSSNYSIVDSKPCPPISEAHDLIKKAVSSVKSVEDCERREEALQILVAGSFLPFHQKDMFANFSEITNCGSFNEERKILPYATPNIGYISENVKSQHMTDANAGVLDEDAVQEAQEEMDVIRDRAKVVAIKQYYAYDKKLKTTLSKDVDDLHDWLVEVAGSEADSNMTPAALIRKNPKLAIACVEPAALVLINKMAEKAFIENVLESVLVKDECKMDDKVYTEHDAMFTRYMSQTIQKRMSTVFSSLMIGDSESLVLLDDIKQRASDYLNSEKVGGGQKSYILPYIQ